VYHVSIKIDVRLQNVGVRATPTPFKPDHSVPAVQSMKCICLHTPPQAPLNPPVYAVASCVIIGPQQMKNLPAKLCTAKQNCLLFVELQQGSFVPCCRLHVHGCLNSGFALRDILVLQDLVHNNCRWDRVKKTWCTSYDATNNSIRTVPCAMLSLLSTLHAILCDECCTLLPNYAQSHVPSVTPLPNSL